MKKNIFQDLPTPFFVQAPMEDVTDSVFRQIIASVGAPDLYFTEFTNVEGIIKGSDAYIRQRLLFSKIERPLIAQIWGNNAEYYKLAARMLNQAGFDGIDINMGCPIRNIIKNGCCSALIKTPGKARELYLAAKDGAGSLPVSIKTRIGFTKIQTDEWISFLLELKPVAITVHARTAKEMSKAPAHWEEFEKIVALRDKISPKTKIIANGDILSKKKGLELVKKYNVDGIMIGRGILHNPWVFNERIKIEEVKIQDRIKLLEKHIELFDKTWGKTKNFELMKKFYKTYLNGFDGASDMRVSVMQYHTAQETIEALEKMIK